MKVLQIYNHVPEHLKNYVESVKAFAERIGADYIIHGDDPDPEFRYKSAWSDLIRIQYASEFKDLWYFDWDILIKDTFTYSESSPAFFYKTPECCFFTGNDLTLFKKWREQLENIIAKHGKRGLKRGMLFRICTEDRDKMNYIEKDILHIEYHRISKEY